MTMLASGCSVQVENLEATHSKYSMKKKNGLSSKRTTRDGLSVFLGSFARCLVLLVLSVFLAWDFLMGVLDF